MRPPRPRLARRAVQQPRPRSRPCRAILARWAEASALARAQQRLRGSTCAYGDGAGETLDVFPRRRAPGAPVLVFIHGGYWRALDKADHSFVAPSFIARRRDGGGAQLRAVPGGDASSTSRCRWLRALAWAWRHAARYGGDPQRIVVAGHSAGGHLAAMLLCCRWKQVADDLPAQLVAGALSISGLYDLEPLRHTPFLQADLQLTPASVRAAEPGLLPAAARAAATPLVGADESEEFLRQNQLIRDVWGPTAVPVCETVPGTQPLHRAERAGRPGRRACTSWRCGCWACAGPRACYQPDRRIALLWPALKLCIGTAPGVW